MARARVLRRWRWLALTVIALGPSMVVLDVSIAAVALPSINNDLRLSLEDLQRVMTGCAIVFGGVLLLGRAPGRSASTAPGPHATPRSGCEGAPRYSHRWFFLSGIGLPWLCGAGLYRRHDRRPGHQPHHPKAANRRPHPLAAAMTLSPPSPMTACPAIPEQARPAAAQDAAAAGPAARHRRTPRAEGTT